MNKQQILDTIKKHKKQPQFSLLILDIPTSKNSLRVRKRNGRETHSSKYLSFRKSTANRFALWQQENPEFEMYEPHSKMVMVFDVQYFFPNMKGDRFLNHSEALADSLTGLLYKDDGSVAFRLTLPSTTKGFIDKDNPRVELDPNPQIISHWQE